MSTLMPFLVLDRSYDQVLVWVKQKLAGAGFRVLKTFDLQVARLAHPECPCPHHETDDCDCQMIVLLVYGKQEDPATLVIHGMDSRSWVSLSGPAGRRASQYLEAVIRRAIMPQLASGPSSIEVTYDTRPAL
jgi:hypothetical protein